MFLISTLLRKWGLVRAKKHGAKSGSDAPFRRGCSLRRAQLIGSQSVLAILGLVPCEVDQEGQIAAEQPPTTCSRQTHGATLRAPFTGAPPAVTVPA